MPVCSFFALSICISVYGISTTLQLGPGPEHTQRIRFKHGWWRQNWFASSYSNSLVSWLFRNWPCFWTELKIFVHLLAAVFIYQLDSISKSPRLCCGHSAAWIQTTEDVKKLLPGPSPHSWGEQSNCCGLISLILFTPGCRLLRC